MGEEALHAIALASPVIHRGLLRDPVETRRTRSRRDPRPPARAAVPCRDLLEASPAASAAAASRRVLWVVAHHLLHRTAGAPKMVSHKRARVAARPFRRSGRVVRAPFARCARSQQPRRAAHGWPTSPCGADCLRAIPGGLREHGALQPLHGITLHIACDLQVEHRQAVGARKLQRLAGHEAEKLDASRLPARIRNSQSSSTSNRSSYRPACSFRNSDPPHRCRCPSATHRTRTAVPRRASRSIERLWRHARRDRHYT